jgi:hypothetical protein
MISQDFLNEFVVLATHLVFTKKFPRAFHLLIQESKLTRAIFRALFIYGFKNQNYARNFMLQFNEFHDFFSARFSFINLRTKITRAIFHAAI